MMQHMGPALVGMGTSLLFWSILIPLVTLLLIGVCIALFTNWLKQQHQSSMRVRPQPQKSFSAYAEGYQEQSGAESVEIPAFPANEPLYPDAQMQYEQPQVQYSGE